MKGMYKNISSLKYTVDLILIFYFSDVMDFKSVPHKYTIGCIFHVNFVNFLSNECRLRAE